MNEQIKELAYEAGIVMVPNSKPISIMGLTTDLEKFAELIIKECMTICEDVTERNDPAIACYYSIKEHFGVK